MAPRGVIVPQYGMTNAAFMGKLRSAMRKEWRNSKMYKDALAAAKKPYTGLGKRKKVIECAECKTQYFLDARLIVPSAKKGKDKDVKAYQVDHMEDAGSLTDLTKLSDFAIRLFCIAERLQVLCYHCHHKKTHKKE